MRRMGTVAALLTALGAGMAGSPEPAAAQELPTDDPVIAAMWIEGMDRSQARDIGQALSDSIGPRLMGTPGYERAAGWAIESFAAWGIPARRETYGTWKGWERGTAHIDLVAPRVRTLTGMLAAWSPGTDEPVEGPVVTLPDVEGPAAFRAWVPEVDGAFVTLAAAEPTCRPESSYEEYGTEASLEAFHAARAAVREAWERRIERIGLAREEILDALEAAGALGVLWTEWAGGWGATRHFALNTRFGASPDGIPAVNLSCEDYGLVHRLAERGQGPRLRLDAPARLLGPVPAFNVVAEIRGDELPEEYVLLSAHFDSWDGASGTTDNGTGTVTMMEAARILMEAYPTPRRTILVGLWGGEEQGLNGSRAFAHDRPDVLEGLQAVFNQDNGTGRVSRVSMQGLLEAGGHFAGWMSRIPSEIGRHIDLAIPGSPGGGGSDYASFICAGAPTFSLGSTNFDYFPYTWHTNLDTFDKIVWEDLANNATLTAMLAYLAAEDGRVPRDRRVLPVDPETGETRSWPACEDGTRETSERYR